MVRSRACPDVNATLYGARGKREWDKTASSIKIQDEIVAISCNSIICRGVVCLCQSHVGSKCKRRHFCLIDLFHLGTAKLGNVLITVVICLHAVWVMLVASPVIQ